MVWSRDHLIDWFFFCSKTSTCLLIGFLVDDLFRLRIQRGNPNAVRKCASNHHQRCEMISVRRFVRSSILLNFQIKPTHRFRCFRISENLCLWKWSNYIIKYTFGECARHRHSRAKTDKLPFFFRERVELRSWMQFEAWTINSHHVLLVRPNLMRIRIWFDHNQSMTLLCWALHFTNRKRNSTMVHFDRC